MNHLVFYALRDDQLELLSYVTNNTDCLLYESRSRVNQPLRCFSAVSELDAAYSVGRNYREDGQPISFELWSPSVTKSPNIRRIQLDPFGENVCYQVEGVGLIRLKLGGVCEEEGTLGIRPSQLGVWSENDARERSMLPHHQCDWQALRRLSSLIHRKIKADLTIASIGSLYLMPQAYVAFRKGTPLCLNRMRIPRESVSVRPILQKQISVGR